MSKREPRLRITRWITEAGIPSNVPLEAECTACPDIRFKIEDDDKHKSQAPSHWANLRILERQFNEHLKLVHPNAEPLGSERSVDAWVNSVRSGNRRKALEQLQSEPDSPSKTSSLGALFMWKGDFKSALNHYQAHILSNLPRDPAGDLSFGMAGSAAWCLGDEKLAVKHWRKGLTAGYAIGGANTRIALLLYAVSVLNRDVSSREAAEKLLEQKASHWRVKNWPGPIAQFILGTATEEEVKKQALFRNREPTRQNPMSWQFAFYRLMKAAASGTITNATFEKKIKKLLVVEGSEYLEGENLFYFLRLEELYIARHWLSSRDCR
jgi:lipoprotein NlpI